MKATRIVVTLALAVLFLGVLATTAYAQNYIAGNLYRLYVSPYNDGNPMATGCNDPMIWQVSPSLVPMRHPDITFMVATNYTGIPLDFDDMYPKSGLMAEAWLTHGSNPSHNVLGLSMYRYSDLSAPRPTCDYISVIDITGFVSVTTGEVFSFDVDDNVWLMINGYMITQVTHATGPYQAAPYWGPSGLFPFRLIYVETNGVHAKLKVTHN
jgi:hypothetical protein